MQFEQRRPDVVRAISQRALIAWWTRARGRARVPDYATPLPERVDADTLMHCDVVRDDGLRFRMRSIGAKLAAAYGGSWPGRFLDEAIAPNLRQAAHETYSKVVESEQPVYSILEMRDQRGHPVHYERLVLPLREQSEGVDRIITSVEMVSLEGAFEDRDLMVRKP